MRCREVHITVLARGCERYVIAWDEAHKEQALRQLGRWASDPQLSFGWHDAARMSAKMREAAKT